MKMLRSRWFWLTTLVVAGVGCAGIVDPDLARRAAELPALVGRWTAAKPLPRRPADPSLGFADSLEIEPNTWGDVEDDSLRTSDVVTSDPLDLDDEPLTLDEIDTTRGFDPLDDEWDFADLDDTPEDDPERELDPSWMYELPLVPKGARFPDEDEPIAGDEVDVVRDEFDPVLDFDPVIDVDLGDAQDWGRVDEARGPLQAALDLEVVAPLRAQQGVDVPIRVVVRSRDTVDVRAVTLVAELEDGLELPGRPDRSARRTFAVVEAGGTSDVTLTVRGTETGRHCVRFVLLAADHEVDVQRICLDVRPRDYAVRVVGPGRRTVGDRAEFTLLLENVSNEPLLDARVTLQHDDVLEPRAGTRGALLQPGRLVWTLGRVESGETVQLQAEFACLTKGSTKLTFEVEADSVVRETRTEELVIEPARNGLEVRLKDDDDPIRVGEETTVRLRVANTGSTPRERIVVRARIPAELEFVSAEVVRGEEILNVRSRQRGDVLEFAVLPKLEGGEAVVYRLRMRSVGTGPAELRTIVSFGASGTSIGRAEWIVVNAEPSERTGLE